MVGYADLSSTNQALVMLNFEFFGKKLFLFACALFFGYYIFVYWKEKKETNFLFTGIIRLFLYATGICFLTMLPFMLFLLYPQVRLDVMLQWMLAFYGVMIFLVFSVASVNILYFSTGAIAEYIGYNPDKKVKKLMNSISKEFSLLLGLNRWKKNK